MPEKNDRWQDRYSAWRVTNHGQEAFAEAEKIAVAAFRGGHRHYSMQMIVYVIRHERKMKYGPDEDGWKMNNNYTSYLAREILQRHPEFPEGFIELRSAARFEPGQQDMFA